MSTPCPDPTPLPPSIPEGVAVNVIESFAQTAVDAHESSVHAKVMMFEQQLACQAVAQGADFQARVRLEAKQELHAVVDQFRSEVDAKSAVAHSLGAELRFVPWRIFLGTFFLIFWVIFSGWFLNDF